MPKKIVVHEKALAHLSRGLYRSPASAIRELVSNGWDANAKIVRISTNYPNFFQISVEDNGDGFSGEDFDRLMGGGIGNSEKRPKAKPLINGRPLIGRLGIGLLGIAQICGTFTLSSKQRNGKAFRARVHLYDLLKERLDNDDPTIVQAEEVDVGFYDFEDVNPDSLRIGTLIVADDVHPTFVRAFQQSLKAPKFETPPHDWKKALRVINRVHTIQELGDYWRLLWELAASTPVPYVSSAAVPEGLIKADQERLEAYDFKVLVDGIELRKPVSLHGNPAGYTTRKIDKQQMKVYGKDLVFHGYLVVQEGLQLRPDELRGILIRIKNVAIGYYDPSMLDYRFNEGPRSRWITGEIYVTEGLEDALNIDRDSFNRFHPQFRAIQEFVHGILHDEVFPNVYKEIDKRSVERHRSKARARSTHFTSVVSKAAAVPVKTVKSTDSDQVELSGNKRKNLVLALPDEDQLQTKKANRQLAAAILGIFELAMKERNPNRRREVFRTALLDLLAKW